MLYLSNAFYDNLLLEDIERGDLTTRALGIFGKAKAQFISRAEYCAAGVQIAARCCKQLGLDCKIISNDGKLLKAGDVIFTASGDAAAIHQAYKVAQCVLEFCCAVASRAYKMQNLAQQANPSARLFGTRKTPPNTRALCTAALFAAGASLHRAMLAETVLIFKQHRKLLNASFKELILRAKAYAPEHKIMVEADNLSEFYEILDSCADIIQCDKFSLQDIKQAAHAAKNAGVCISAAGGINESNIADYAAAGVDILISSAQYYAPSADIKVDIEPIN